MSKIYKTFDELCKDIGEQDGQCVFEIKQQEIDQLKARILELEETLEDVTKINKILSKSSVDISDVVTSVNTVLNLLK